MGEIRKNFIINCIYQVVAIIVPIILTPYLTRTLGSAGLGCYSFYFSCAYYFTLFAMLGYMNYGNRSIAKVNDDRQERTKVFWEIYSLQLVTAGLAFAVYCLYGSFFSEDSRIVWCFSGYVLASVFDVNWFFFGMEKFKITVTRSFLLKVITVFSVLFMVKTENDVYLYALIVSIGTLLANLLLVTQLPEFIGFTEWKKMNIYQHIKPVFVLFIPCLAISLYKVMDKVMLGIMSNMDEVGFYESSERLINLPMAFITALGTVMLPRISKLVHSEEAGKSKVYFQKSLELIMFLSSSMCFGIIAVADIFIPLFFGEGFEKCVSLLTILMPSCLFLAFANVVRTQYLIPHEMDKPYVTSLLLGAAVNFGINFVMIPRYESIGAGIGTLLAEASVCVYQCWSVRKYIEIRRCIKKVMPYIVAGMIMCLCVVNLENIFYIMPVFMLMIKILAGVVLYMVLICIFSKRLLMSNKFFER